MTAEKSTCSLSLDLDNKWSYMKTHGDSGWESFPSYLDLVVPRFLDALDHFGWKITVFVVGRDAALEKNREALQMIADAGHEFGNHSFEHEPWLHLYSKQQVEEEIVGAEEAIENATDQRPCGFRGPGYSLSRDVLEVLAERRYLYDASTFPTYLGPLARSYYFLTSDLDEKERSERKELFGKFRDGLQPLKPYHWDLGNHNILEIPVTTLPVLKFPIHFSYLLYIATFSPLLAKLYFRTALSACHLLGIEPSLLLHPLDFLGGSDVPELLFFPAMNLELSKKRGHLLELLSLLGSRYEIVGMKAYQRRCSGRGTAGRLRTPDMRT